MEYTDQIHAELLRYMGEYHWKPRIVKQLLNLRHGTNYTAKDVAALYSQLCPHEPDPVAHLLHQEQRRSPILPEK